MDRKRTWRIVDSSPLAFHVANDLDGHGANERQLARIRCRTYGQGPHGAHDVFHLPRLEELDGLQRALDVSEVLLELRLGRRRRIFTWRRDRARGVDRSQMKLDARCYSRVRVSHRR